MTIGRTAGSGRLLVRADASLSIGMGHLVRSLALADTFHQRGWHVFVASRTMPAIVRDEIGHLGFQLIELDDVPFDSEPAAIASAVPSGGVDLTVVDHYEISARWHRDARRWSRLVVAIDDLAEAPLDVDVVVNQNLGEDEASYDGLLPPGARRLVGPRYALLRKQFVARRGPQPKVRTSVQRVLIAMGGSDARDVTRVAAEAMAGLGVTTDVVVGVAYPNFEELRAWADGVPSITLHRNVADMAELMDRADLAIGAPGSASWERCCLGLPAVTVTLADNQARAARALHESGAAISLGWHDVADATAIAETVGDLGRRPELLSAMSQAAARVTDGQGARRVGDILEHMGGGGETT